MFKPVFLPAIVTHLRVSVVTLEKGPTFLDSCS